MIPLPMSENQIISTACMQLRERKYYESLSKVQLFLIFKFPLKFRPKKAFCCPERQIKMHWWNDLFLMRRFGSYFWVPPNLSCNDVESYPLIPHINPRTINHRSHCTDSSALTHWRIQTTGKKCPCILKQVILTSNEPVSLLTAAVAIHPPLSLAKEFESTSQTAGNISPTSDTNCL